MNSRLTFALAVFSVLSGGALAQSKNVSTPAARQAALKIVENLMAEKPAPAAGAEAVKDPFNPSEQDLREDFDPNAAPKEVKQVALHTDADLLQEFAKLILPTGSVTLGGNLTCCFARSGKKRVIK